MGTTPFNDLEETKFHREMEPIADQLYYDIWGPLQKLERLSHSRVGPPHPLDKDWAIDVILQTMGGLTITIQDKFRQYKYYRDYNQFTLEYENNPATHEPGEFFHLVANYYFYGFATIDKQSFISWKVIDLNPFKECYRVKAIVEDGTGYNKKKSRASFIFFNWDKLRDKGLLFRESKPPESSKEAKQAELPRRNQRTVDRRRQKVDSRQASMF
ncbi:hypothetical protein ES703_35072 [subsurface metagenome]